MPRLRDVTNSHTHKLCADDEDTVNIICHCLALACKIYSDWGCMSLRPTDIEKVKVDSLIGLTANTRLDIIIYCHKTS